MKTQIYDDFRRTYKSESKQIFSESFPHPFLLYQIGGTLDGKSSGRQTVGLETEKIAKKMVISNHPVYVVGLIKSEGSSNPFNMISIGRTSTADITIMEVHVSKTHCYFKESPGEKWFITDPGSSNGTYVNGKRLNFNQAQKIEDGNQIVVGQEVFMVFIESVSLWKKFQRDSISSLFDF